MENKKTYECGCELVRVKGGWAFIDQLCKRCEKHKAGNHPFVDELKEEGFIG